MKILSDDLLRMLKRQLSRCQQSGHSVARSLPNARPTAAVRQTRPRSPAVERGTAGSARDWGAVWRSRPGARPVRGKPGSSRAAGRDVP